MLNKNLQYNILIRISQLTKILPHMSPFLRLWFIGFLLTLPVGCGFVKQISNSETRNQ
ncbi:hypothetical protein J6590_088557 [Homalodisca vitripennis]|nr:hypothetical protein J6590_088557 [Homalodisca vitripennis]